MFIVEIQSPFSSVPIIYPDHTINAAIELYENVDWPDLYKQIEATEDTPESPFYYYKVSGNNNIGKKESLCLFGYMQDMVGIEYTRPKFETKGFFIKKQVLNPEYQTRMIKCDLSFADSCLHAFFRGNSTYLEESLYNNDFRNY